MNRILEIPDRLRRGHGVGQAPRHLVQPREGEDVELHSAYMCIYIYIYIHIYIYTHIHISYRVVRAGDRQRIRRAEGVAILRVQTYIITSISCYIVLSYYVASYFLHLHVCVSIYIYIYICI